VRGQAALHPHGESGHRRTHDHPHHATGPAAHHAADPDTGPGPDSDNNPDPAHHEHTSRSGSNTPDSPAAATTNPRKGSTTFTRRPSHAGHGSTSPPASWRVSCSSGGFASFTLTEANPLRSAMPGS
jgi:hypothetical protein